MLPGCFSSSGCFGRLDARAAFVVLTCGRDRLLETRYQPRVCLLRLSLAYYVPTYLMGSFCISWLVSSHGCSEPNRSSSNSQDPSGSSTSSMATSKASAYLWTWTRKDDSSCNTWVDLCRLMRRVIPLTSPELNL